MANTSETARIEKIIAAVRKASQGDLAVSLDISKDNDLLDSLAAAVNELTGNLSKRAAANRQLQRALLNRDRLLRNIFDQAPYPIWICDNKGTLIRINQACCDMVHVRPADVIGKYNILQDTIIEEQGYRPLVESVFEEGKTVNFSITYDSSYLKSFSHTILQDTVDEHQKYHSVSESVFEEGETGRFSMNSDHSRLRSFSQARPNVIIVDVTISPVKDESGTITNGVVIHRDITERRELEEELEYFRFSIERATDGVFWLDRSGHIIYVNEQACRSLGYTKGELQNLYLWDIDPDYPEKRWVNTWKESAEAGQRLITTWHRHKDGTLLPVEISTNHIKLGDKEYHVAYVRDISERIEAERLLHEIDLKLKDAQEMAGLGYWVWDVGTGNVEWSDETYKIFELDPKEFTPHLDSIMALSPWPGDNNRDQEIMQKVIETHEQTSFEQRFLRPDGSIGHYFSTCRGIFDDNDTLITLMGTVQDISERKQAEEEIRESEEKYRSVVDNIGIGIALIGRNMEVLSVNKKIREWFPGIDFASNPVCYKTYNCPPRQEPCSYCAAIKSFQDGAVHETITETPAGERTINFRIITSPLKDSAGEVIAVVEMLEDITERIQFEKEKQKLEKQLLQAQKMEAVGTLAGGIAHDFNNMLSVIIGYVGLLKDELAGEPSLLANISEIEKAALRSRDTTRQLLAFSRQQAIAPKPINLIDHIRDLEKTLGRLIGEDVDLLVHLENDLWRINFDPSQLDQILFNLAVNARDAMPDGGKITIEAENIVLDEDYCLIHHEAVPGKYVLLMVSDNGSGMDQEILSHAFEPFFSTKAIGKGTGLGLATVFGIVKQNSGLIDVYSEPGQGTTFKIYIPKLTAQDQPKVIARESLDSTATGTVLLVEDDEMVRDMTRKMLESMGYTVLAAESTTAALALCQKSGEGINLLLTDVIMPDMNGAELRDKILGLCPEMKVLFMSGYTAAIISRHGVLDRGVKFIQKPFSKKELARKVRDALWDN